MPCFAGWYTYRCSYINPSHTHSHTCTPMHSASFISLLQFFSVLPPCSRTVCAWRWSTSQLAALPRSSQSLLLQPCVIAADLLSEVYFVANINCLQRGLCTTTDTTLLRQYQLFALRDLLSASLFVRHAYHTVCFCVSDINCSHLHSYTNLFVSVRCCSPQPLRYAGHGALAQHESDATHGIRLYTPSAHRGDPRVYSSGSRRQRPVTSNTARPTMDSHSACENGNCFLFC
jgi:hypothetical protein